MTCNETQYLKVLEKRQYQTKRDIRRIESFLAAHPGYIRADKARKLRLRKIYDSLILREMIREFHKQIVEPRQDRYVHVDTYRKLRAEVDELRGQVKKLRLHELEVVA